MKRLQIQLDEETYRRLREEAHARGTSMAAVVREVLAKSLGVRRKRLEDFGFIGAGASEQGGLSPVSERHDEALSRSIG